MPRPVKVKEKVIDGETWYHFNDEFQRRKYIYGNYLMVSLIIILLVLGIGLFYTIATHIKEIKTHPFIYGAEKHPLGINICTCWQDNGATFNFNETNIWSVG